MIHLERITSSSNQPARASLDQPLDHLLACHRRIEERLEILERAADHLANRRAEAVQAMENCFRFLDSNGVWHTEDEEQSVFPRLRGRINDQDARFLSDLEADHREAERTYRELKTRFQDAGAIEGIRELVRCLCRHYRQHIAAEDAHLISLAREALGKSELAAISREMKARRCDSPSTPTTVSGS